MHILLTGVMPRRCCLLLAPSLETDRDDAKYRTLPVQTKSYTPVEKVAYCADNIAEPIAVAITLWLPLLWYGYYRPYYGYGYYSPITLCYRPYVTMAMASLAISLQNPHPPAGAALIWLRETRAFTRRFLYVAP